MASSWNSAAARHTYAVPHWSDGYGDVTQDSCPTVASIHEGPCPAPPSGGGGPGATAPAVPPAGPRAAAPRQGSGPVISALSLRPKSFRAKPVGPTEARGRSGTKIYLTLSTKATVKLAIEAKRGHRYAVVTNLAKQLGGGKRTIAFSGRYRHAGMVTDLAPGTYRLSATAKGIAGTGPARWTTFTVLPPG